MSDEDVKGAAGPPGLRVRPEWPRLLLLASILAGLFYLKLGYTPEHYHTDLDPWADGGYYFEIAQHVRDGEGLVTNVSLMHKGYPAFPHPTSVYPLWPFLLGYLARLWPLESVAVVLPVVLYFASLIFGYLFGRRLLPEPFFPWRFAALDAGHVVVLIFGLHAGYFRSTSSPLTEGLCYTLLLGGLWACLGAWQRPRPGIGLLLGLWLSLLFLTRSQMVIVALAAFATSGLAMLLQTGKRREHALMAAAMLVGFVPLVAWHYGFIAGFVKDVGPMSLLRFDKNRVTGTMGELHVMMPTRTFWSFVEDRAHGFKLAWWPWGRYSFAQGFHVLHYALPPALLVALWRAIQALRRGDVWARLLGWLRAPSSARWLFVLGIALPGYFSIHLIHKITWSEWNFGLRQALTCGFLFFLAHCLLLRSRFWLAPLLSLSLLGYGSYVAWQRLHHEMRTAQEKPLPAASPRPRLLQWLQHQRRQRGELTVAFVTPHRVAPYTRDIGYHAVIRNRTSAGDLQRLVNRLGVRYVVLPNDPRGWYMLRRNSDFYRRFIAVVQLDDMMVWAPRPVIGEPR